MKAQTIKARTMIMKAEIIKAQTITIKAQHVIGTK